MQQNSRKQYTILNVFEIKKLDEHEAILKKLKSGLDVDSIDSGGRTLLMEATVRQEHTLMSILINFGANVNVRDNRDWTALHFAAQNYDINATKLLIENGADINAKDFYNNNVISKAVMMSKGRGEVIEFLLEHGADYNMKNKSGISALDTAKTISNYDVFQFFAHLN